MIFKNKNRSLTQGLLPLGLFFAQDSVVYVPFLKSFRKGSALPTIDLGPVFLQMGLCQHLVEYVHLSERSPLKAQNRWAAHHLAIQLLVEAPS